MSDYLRYFVPGGMYFLTVVSYNRFPLFANETGRGFLRKAIEQIRVQRPFEITATVLLPDHWHLIMQLPIGDDDFPTRMKRIKENFTNMWRSGGRPEQTVSQSQQRRGERGIWQPRFWEHCVKDQDDLERCVDYIHWNPRKHNLVSTVKDWPYSSFHRFVAKSQYDVGWGGTVPVTIERDVHQDWGELVVPRRR